LAPDAFTPRLNIGIVLLHKRDYTRASTELQRAVNADSSSGVAHLYLGRAFIQMGIYDKAEIELRRAIALDESESVEAHRYLGAVYIKTGKQERAAEELDAYLRLPPNVKDAEKIRKIVRQQRNDATARK